VTKHNPKGLNQDKAGATKLTIAGTKGATAKSFAHRQPTGTSCRKATAFRVTVSEGEQKPDESLFSCMASNTLEENAMPEPTDKNKLVDPIKRDLENARMARPAWALHRQSQCKSDDASGTILPKSFIDAVLEVIAQSIEKALAEVMARCVAEGVEQKIRPLAGEIALLRIAFENDWNNENQRQRGKVSESNENPA
jgi:hypothetical protein